MAALLPGYMNGSQPCSSTTASGGTLAESFATSSASPSSLKTRTSSPSAIPFAAATLGFSTTQGRPRCSRSSVGEIL